MVSELISKAFLCSTIYLSILHTVNHHKTCWLFSSFFLHRKWHWIFILVSQLSLFLAHSRLFSFLGFCLPLCKHLVHFFFFILFHTYSGEVFYFGLWFFIPCSFFFFSLSSSSVLIARLPFMHFIHLERYRLDYGL